MNLQFVNFSIPLHTGHRLSLFQREHGYSVALQDAADVGVPARYGTGATPGAALNSLSGQVLNAGDVQLWAYFQRFIVELDTIPAATATPGR